MQRRDHLNACHAVDRTVVQFQRHRERAARYSGHGVQALDDRDLPRRPTQINLPGMQPRDLDTELSPVTRLREPDMTDVILKVEAGVIYPVGPMQTTRQVGQPPPKDIRKMQPGFELGENPLEGHGPARSSRRVVDQQHLDL